MNSSKLVKIIFLIAGLMLSIKPIVGFGIIQHAKSTDSGVNTWLLQKLFSKRKQDYLEDDLVQVIAIQQKLSKDDFKLLRRFCCYLLSLFRLSIDSLHDVTNRHFTDLTLKMLPERDIYLSSGKLTI